MNCMNVERPRADLDRDRWIQNPECQPLHQEAMAATVICMRRICIKPLQLGWQSTEVVGSNPPHICTLKVGPICQQQPNTFMPGPFCPTLKTVDEAMPSAEMQQGRSSAMCLTMVAPGDNAIPIMFEICFRMLLKERTNNAI